MFLDSGDKPECYGCGGCAQICPRGAIKMELDEEGFFYPVLDPEKCIGCGLCRKTCPYEQTPQKHEESKYTFGGYNLDARLRFESTSGGAFSAIAETFCDDNYVVFGAEAKGMSVFHSYITDKHELGKFRKSKYLQSNMGKAFRDVKEFLAVGKKVLFSGTPCQIAGLLAYLEAEGISHESLLTVEVVCEGVPSPLYIKKLEETIEKKHGMPIESLDYRYTGKSLFGYGKWDFQQMRIKLKDKVLIKDRWFNPFWSVWLQHLMSRPSCYRCKFAEKGRVADITLGDLWGVHIYCPELYGENGGASLVVCNTEKGKDIFAEAQKRMYGHALDFDEALKFQGPMRSPIADNPRRAEFMHDLKSTMDYASLNRKWAAPITIKLLFQKYVWGNRQKIFLWNMRRWFSR